MTWKGHNSDQVVTDEAKPDIINLVLYGPRPTSVTEVFIEGRRLDSSEYLLNEDGVLTLQVPELTDANPTQPGWYATLECWDVREGLFPGAHYWTGSQWQCGRRASIQHWPIVFETEAAAEAYAYEHDPER